MLARLLAVALAADLAGCNGCDVPETEAGVVTYDAQPNTQTSTCNGTVVTSDWPGYRRLTELGSCCADDVALDAGASLPALHWIPCQNGATRCEEIERKWDSSASAFFSVSPVTRDGVGAPAVIPLGFPLSGSETMWGFYSLPSLTPLAGFRTDTGLTRGFTEGTCEFDALPVGATAFAMLARVGANGAIKAAHGSMTSATTPSFVTLVPPRARSGFQTNYASATRLAYDVPYGGIYQWVFDSATVIQSKNGDGVDLHLDFLEGDDVFAYSNHSTTGWYSEYRVGGDGVVSLFRGVSGRQIYAMRTDGTTLAWCEAYGANNPSWQQPIVELWTAPYTSSATELAATAKKLATLPSTAMWCGGGTSFVQGYYAAQTGSKFDVVTVIRVSDGAYQQVGPGPDRSFAQVAFATRTELWALLDRVLDAGGKFGGYAFARYQLGSWR